MANEHQPEGGFSRRGFIKTAAAATAAASVGMMPSPLPEATSRPPDWEISGDKLRLLWAKIYPKIVAYSWKDKDTEDKDTHFRANFSGKENRFRARAVNTVAGILGYVDWDWDCMGSPSSQPPQWWPENVPINILELKDEPELGDFRTQIYIVPDGIWLPWPANPYSLNFAPPKALELEYILRGGFLPRNRTISSKEADIYNCIVNGLSKINPDDFQAGEVAPLPTDQIALTGQTVFDLMDQLSRIIPLTMINANVKNSYKKRPTNVITDVSLPPGLVIVKPEENPGNQDLKIESTTNEGKPILKLTLPLPAALPDSETVFKELILGYASNPMYSNCY